MTPTIAPTIAEAARGIAARTISPVELTQACIARIEARDPVLHAFILRTPERALADARAAEARAMRRGLRGPLDGIPIGHKDIYETAGLPTTAHSKLLADHVPAADAQTVTMLAGAGVVMLGKLATHEFAIGGPSFDLPWPPARNPWDTTRFTSGSSSGTGAAVADGMILGGTGSDTGGSIRGPAALCGVAGIKPTYGRCSRRGILPLAFSLDHAGPLAWTAEDCALLLQAMAGHDPLDPGSADVPVLDFSAGIGGSVRGLRVGVVRHFHEVDNPATPGCARAVEDAARVLAAAGAAVRSVTLPPLMDYQAANSLILTAEAWTLHEPWITTRFHDYGDIMRSRLAMGAVMSAADYVQALRRRRELVAATREAMAELDVLLVAGAQSEAPVIETVPKWSAVGKPGFTAPFNLTGLPALTVCAGFGEGGLPVGVQVVGHPWAEATVLRAGHVVEQELGERGRRPAG
jgi:aspartyl-tRNA(Asn)/glutamyl-tRNA(Gln) amidotransferase subunit A